MNGVTVCRLSDAYIAQAVSLSLEVFAGGSVDSLTSCFTNEANRFFAAISDGQLVGFGGYSIAADQADVIDVAVAPAYRRRGIARTLMQTTLSDAAERGASQIFLEVRASNVPAAALYTALGFTACGVRKNYYKNPREDAVLMTRPLGAASESDKTEEE